ncbi:MAG: phosphopentomutase [Rhodothalassiaceae bacterium]
MRAIVAVMDSFGIGAAEDAARFGDTGADTYGHVRQACATGGIGRGPLNLPNLSALGLDQAAAAARGEPHRAAPQPQALFGFAAEQSRGKDTPSGHWEMMGLPVLFDWGYFPDTQPSFPPALTEALVDRAGLPGVLGDCHASGTQIIERLGEEHVRTGKPIVYTSADSVFQIAAHEQAFGLDRLIEVCTIARDLVDDYRIGRVIARPFVGETAADFQRTGNRKDLATPPHADTLLNLAEQAGREVIAIGKIADIFAGSGITSSVKAHGNDAVFDALLAVLDEAGDGALVFANFVDFDTLYGHRRDVAGYAAALEAFDRRLPELHAALKPGDLAVITADHGCDPTFRGTDHTREYVPVLAFGPGLAPGPIGRRESFADIGQSLAKHLRLPPTAAGVAFV